MRVAIATVSGGLLNADAEQPIDRTGEHVDDLLPATVDGGGRGHERIARLRSPQWPVDPRRGDTLAPPDPLQRRRGRVDMS
jgi:hypothetical protein